jgi:hypothetical protein
MRKVDSIKTVQYLYKEVIQVPVDKWNASRAMGVVAIARLEAIHEGIYELVNKPADKAVIIQVVVGFAVKSTEIQSVMKRDGDDNRLQDRGRYEICIIHSDNAVKQIYFDSEEERDKRYDDLLREWKGKTTSD